MAVPSKLGGGVAVSAILALAALCVTGAFLGADRAKAFFNSMPMAVFWAALATLLVGSLAYYRNLTRNPGLFAMHLGAVLVLAGAFVGSAAASDAAARFLGSSKIPSGRMVLVEGASADALLDAGLTREVGRLPFAVRLDRFSIERYEPNALPAAASTIDPGLLQSTMPVRSYRSDVAIIAAASPLVEGSITVNRPLHYGGYHFYQFACGIDNGHPYTVLSVVSDSGLTLVYVGFVGLCLGAFYWSWIGSGISTESLRGAHGL
jgi:cytochrome c biogenesis protein ResB